MVRPGVAGGGVGWRWLKGGKGGLKSYFQQLRFLKKVRMEGYSEMLIKYGSKVKQ